MKKGKYLLAGLVVLAGMTGCTFDREHDRRHVRSWVQDMQDQHRFIDKYFFNYDEKDPDRY